MPPDPHSRETLNPSFTVRIEPLRERRGFYAGQDRGGRPDYNIQQHPVAGRQGEGLSEPGCSGTQSSRRVDNESVEILRKCASGEWSRFVRRSAAEAKELILDITEQHPDGRRFERRLVMEKQSEAGRKERINR